MLWLMSNNRSLDQKAQGNDTTSEVHSEAKYDGRFGRQEQLEQECCRLNQSNLDLKRNTENLRTKTGTLLRENQTLQLQVERAEADAACWKKLSKETHQIAVAAGPLKDQRDEELQEERIRTREFREQNYKLREQLALLQSGCSQSIRQDAVNADLLKEQKYRELQRELQRERGRNHELHEQNRKLQGQLMLLKSDRSQSTRLEKQVTGETIQNDLESLYFSIQDWAVGMARLKDSGKPTFDGLSQNFAYPIRARRPPPGGLNKDLLKHNDLAQYVPQFTDSSSANTRYAIMAVISLAITKMVNQARVFGTVMEGPLVSANLLYRVMIGQPEHFYIARTSLLTSERDQQPTDPA